MHALQDTHVKMVDGNHDQFVGESQGGLPAFVYAGWGEVRVNEGQVTVVFS